MNFEVTFRKVGMLIPPDRVQMGWNSIYNPTFSFLCAFHLHSNWNVEPERACLSEYRLKRSYYVEEIAQHKHGSI
jgi:hypothetical protein